MQRTNMQKAILGVDSSHESTVPMHEGSLDENKVDKHINLVSSVAVKNLRSIRILSLVVTCALYE